VQFNIREHSHLDYGYVVTGHGSQGVTADIVLVHVDTEQAHEQLINSRLAYVSLPRGQARCPNLYERGPQRRLGAQQRSLKTVGA